MPDSKTFWLFREQLIEKEVILGLFKIFNKTFDVAGVLSNQRKMVDASLENSMHGSIARTIGIARAKAKIGMMNLTYNICRCTQLKIVVAPLVSGEVLMG